MSLPTVFVIGATGAQGGAVARALLNSKKWGINALVRDPDSAASQALQAQGASLIKGDWSDIPAIEAAAKGCHGLFLNTYPSFVEDDLELRLAQNILKASKEAGAKHVIYSSAIGVDRYETLVNPDPKSFFGSYFRNKRGIEEAVQNGGWETWTIFRGSFFMSNFMASFNFPELASQGIIVSAYTPETNLLLIDPEDFGPFALATLSNPAKFGGQDINIAAEGLGLVDIGKLIEKVSGKKVEVRFRTEEEIESFKGKNPVVSSQVNIRKVGTWMNVEDCKAWGVPLTSFEEFLVERKDDLVKSIGPAA